MGLPLSPRSWHSIRELSYPLSLRRCVGHPVRMSQTRRHLCAQSEGLSQSLLSWRPTQRLYDLYQLYHRKGLRRCARHPVREQLNGQWCLRLKLPTRMTANETTVHVPDGGSEEMSRNNL